MSELVVEVCAISDIKPHPGADRLDIAQVKGWQIIIKKGEFIPGQLVIYFPPDTILPKTWTDQWGVSNYCSEKPEGMRIRQAKLRGEPSFGLVIPVPDPTWDVGKDVASHYSAQKYEPPILGQQGDVAGKEHPLFNKYTDIENLQNFPDVFQGGEEVVATEKIHGTCVRLSCIEGEVMAGSKKLPRKKPETEEDMKRNFYWMPYSIPSVKHLIDVLGQQHKVVILYGETYGKVQNLTYGIPKQLAFRAFDLYIDGKFLNWEEFAKTCDEFGVTIAPIIYRGPYDLETIKRVSDGKTLIGGDHIREGVVVKPVIERTHPKVGRVIFKRKGDSYMLGKFSEGDTTDV